TSGSGVPRGTVERSVYDVLLGQCTAAEAVMTTQVKGLDIIPATQDLVAAELEMVDLPDRATRLRDALHASTGGVADRYKFVILDCPPSLGLLTVNALVAADRVIVPLQCEYFALEGLTHLMATIDRIKGAFNAELAVEGVVLTMFDGRNSLTHQVADEVREHFRVYSTVIPRNVRLSEAPSHGLPALLYDAQSRGAQAYLGLAREVLDGNTSPAPESTANGSTGEAAPTKGGPAKGEAAASRASKRAAKAEAKAE
ncbi:MAG: ParA family protein, partial [Polyangiaceae bacterium]|nr:ParA family protein [Polyangiaceae bacterium]